MENNHEQGTGPPENPYLVADENVEADPDRVGEDSPPGAQSEKRDPTSPTSHTRDKNASQKGVTIPLLENARVTRLR